MKKKLSLIILGFLMSSCNFLRTAKTEKVSTESASQSYDGTYINQINKYHALWPILTDNKSKNATGTVTFRTLNKNTLLISHFEISSRYHSYIIKGKLKEDGFHFQKKRRLSGIFPLVWAYDRSSYILKTNEKGEIILFEKGFTFVSFFIPMMGANGTHTLVLKKVSETP